MHDRNDNSTIWQCDQFCHTFGKMGSSYSDVSLAHVHLDLGFSGVRMAVGLLGL